MCRLVTAKLPHRTTRGKSRPGRLRLLDRYLREAEGALLARRDGAYAHARCVDVGLGASAHTTVEWTTWLRTHWPELQVLGIDNDPQRVHAALTHHGRPGLRYVEASFAPRAQEPARLVRAINLLRDYCDSEVATAWAAMARDLLPGGLLVEGSTDKQGRVLVAHLLRRRPNLLEHEAMLFATDLSRGFAPPMFRSVLPRALRARTGPGAQVRAFLDHWTAAWSQGHARAEPPVEFARAAQALRGDGSPVHSEPSLPQEGILVWRAPTLHRAFSLALP